MPTENETLLNIETEVNNILNDLDLFTKLTEIEDFMREKYNIEITSDAEANNGFVTFSANVTDADENPSEGILVKFEKANGDLLGKCVSDSNGDVALDLKDENNVYTLVVNVDCTPYADMKEVYIKEPGNLLPLNVWSGTDALRNRSGFSWGTGVNTSSSREWSSIGDRSLEMIKTGSSSFNVYANSTEFMGFTALSCKFDVLTNDGTMVCRLGTPDFQNISSTTVPASDEMQTVILSAILPPGQTVGRVTFLPQVNDVPMYVDNIYMTGTSGGNILFYDPALTGSTADWRNWNTNGTRTPTSTGTLLECTGTTYYMVYANAYGTSGGVYDYNAPYTVEFDVVSQTNSPTFQLYSADTEENFERELTVTGHYKFSYDGESVSWWIGETEQTSETIELLNARAGFKVGVGRNLKFRDFIIYKEEED